MSKLIFETGNCKLKGFDYPVRIHATDGGASGTGIIGDYRDPHRGWVNYSWSKTGTHSSFNEDINLVPVPPSQYFNIYTNADGDITNISKVHHSLESALARKLSKNGTTYKYTDGVIEKGEEE